MLLGSFHKQGSWGMEGGGGLIAMGGTGILTQSCLLPEPASITALLTVSLSVPFFYPAAALKPGLEFTELFSLRHSLLC